jgi:hypothetical protein
MLQTTTAEARLDEGNQRFWLREAERLAVLAVTGPAAIEFGCRAALTD